MFIPPRLSPYPWQELNSMPLNGYDSRCTGVPFICFIFCETTKRGQSKIALAQRSGKDTSAFHRTTSNRAPPTPCSAQAAADSRHCPPLFRTNSSHRKQLTWLRLKKPPYQNRTLVSGNMDQNLRNPSCLILSYTHMLKIMGFQSPPQVTTRPYCRPNYLRETGLGNTSGSRAKQLYIPAFQQTRFPRVDPRFREMHPMGTVPVNMLCVCCVCAFSRHLIPL